jgi:hypothetical protein
VPGGLHWFDPEVVGDYLTEEQCVTITAPFALFDTRGLEPATQLVEEWKADPNILLEIIGPRFDSSPSVPLWTDSYDRYGAVRYRGTINLNLPDVGIVVRVEKLVAPQ